LEPETIDFISYSEDHSRNLGRQLGELVQPGQVIALTGDLGTGKTRWAQGMGAGLDVPTGDIINSPTFTFINQYQGRLPYYHIDLYRLASVEEAETLGLEDYFYGDGVCLIEWANRIQPVLPAERLEIELYFLAETKRRVVMRAYGEEYRALLIAFKKRAFS